MAHSGFLGVQKSNSTDECPVLYVGDECYRGKHVASRLFGDAILFSGRGVYVEEEDDDDKSDHQIVVERLQRHLDKLNKVIAHREAHGDVGASFP